MRMRHVIICGLPRSTIFSPTLSHKRRDFRKEITKHKMCSDFSTKFVWNISHSKKNWARYRSPNAILAQLKNCPFGVNSSSEVKHVTTWNLTIFQLDATYSVYYISVGSPTCFGCWHPSSGARTTVNTALVLINRISYHPLSLLSWNNSTTRACTSHPLRQTI